MHTYDNSQLSTYQTCPFAYYLQYIVGIKKQQIDDTNAMIQFGEYAHKVWEKYFGGQKINFDEITKDYQEHEDLPQYSKQSLKVFMDAYHAKYKEEDKKFKVLEVEKASEIDLYGHKFIVKRDAVVAVNDNIFGLEHKTTKSISYNYFDKYFLSSQISAQTFDIFEKYNTCAGVILNVGEIKALKRKPTSAYDGCLENNGVYITARFARDYCNRSKTELANWKQNTVRWIEKIEESKEKNDWPQCMASWGGTICAKCQFKELCKTSCGLELDESILDVLYQKVDDPFAYLNQKEAIEE